MPDWQMTSGTREGTFGVASTGRVAPRPWWGSAGTTQKGPNTHCWLEAAGVNGRPPWERWPGCTLQGREEARSPRPPWSSWHASRGHVLSMTSCKATVHQSPC